VAWAGCEREGGALDIGLSGDRDIGYRESGYRVIVIGYRVIVIGYRLSAIGYRLIGDRTVHLLLLATAERNPIARSR
jgi:hypothetical protein